VCIEAYAASILPGIDAPPPTTPNDITLECDAPAAAILSRERASLPHEHALTRIATAELDKVPIA